MSVTLEQIEEQEKLNCMIANFKVVSTMFPISIQAPKLDAGEKWAGVIISADGKTKHHKILLPEIYTGKSEWEKVMDCVALLLGYGVNLYSQ